MLAGTTCHRLLDVTESLRKTVVHGLLHRLYKHHAQSNRVTRRTPRRSFYVVSPHSIPFSKLKRKMKNIFSWHSICLTAVDRSNDVIDGHPDMVVVVLILRGSIRCNAFIHPRNVASLTVLCSLHFLGDKRDNSSKLSLHSHCPCVAERLSKLWWGAPATTWVCSNKGLESFLVVLPIIERSMSTSKVHRLLLRSRLVRDLRQPSTIKLL